jgi:hypothetical protein
METAGTYSPQRFVPGDFPEADLQPDAPPDPELLGDSRYVLTGEYYVDVESMRHFQLWLWESSTGALTYTDEMLFEDTEEAGIYLPPLVTWVFSKIPAVTAAAEEAEPEPVPELVSEPVPELVSDPVIETKTDKPGPTRRLYLGLRGGGSLNIHRSQTYGDYAAGTSMYPGAAAAVDLEFRIFRFLSLQGEAVFNYDIFEIGRPITQQTDYITDMVQAMSFRFPLLIKVPLQFGIFTSAVFGGAYGILFLGKANIQYNEGGTGSYSAWLHLPIGIVGGLELSFSLGSGEIFLDLRYVRDLDNTRLVEGSTGKVQYFREEASLSVGYKFLLWKRRNP